MPPVTTVQALQDRGYSSLVAAVTEAGLVATVNAGTYTIFAPSNAAFDALYDELDVSGPS